MDISSFILTSERGEPFIRDLNEVILLDIYLRLPSGHCAPFSSCSSPSASILSPTTSDATGTRMSVSQRIRSSVASHQTSSRSISPPLDITDKGAVGSLSLPFSTKKVADTNKLVSASDSAALTHLRHHLTARFASVTFGRDPSLKGTPFYLRHVSVSRYHFSVFHAPVDALTSDAVASGALSHEDLRKLLQTVKVSSRPTGSKKGRRQSSSEMVISKGYRTVVFVIAWSRNPTFVNEHRVRCGEAVLLQPGDIVSVLESALDPHRGVCRRSTGEEKGKGITSSTAIEVVYNWRDSEDSVSSPPTEEMPTSIQTLAESEQHPSSVSVKLPFLYPVGSKLVVESPEVDDEFVPDIEGHDEDATYNAEASLWESPLRCGVSTRNEKPLPVFQLHVREPSPQATVVSLQRAPSVQTKLTFDEPSDAVVKRKKRSRNS